LLRPVRVRARAPADGDLLLERLHRHLPGAREGPRARRRRGGGVGGRRAPPRPRRPPPALRPRPPVHHPGSMVVGVRRGCGPAAPDLASVAAPVEAAWFDAAVALFAFINKQKSERAVSIGRGITSLRVAAPQTVATRLDAVVADVAAATRVERHELVSKAELA